jgi:LysR family hydrogen peroxide-inducible transcriptional activator
MEMQQVRYFLALARELNFTRAAEACKITQPALTRSIKAMEDEFGGPLFNRERNNTHLSELGRTILPFVEAIQDQTTAVIARTREYNNLGSSSLKLGVMCTTGPAVLSRLILNFHEQYSGTTLNVSDGEQSEIVDKLIRGELEVAILNIANLPTERLHILPLYTERFVVILPQDHPLVANASIHAQDLVNQPYVNRAECEVDHDMVACLMEQGVDLKVVFRSRRDDWVLAMINAGLGFGFFPEFYSAPDNIEVRPLIEPAFERTLSLVTLKGRPHSPAVGALIKMVKSFDWPQSAGSQDDWVVQV